MQVFFNTLSTPMTFPGPMTIGSTSSKGGVFGHFSSGSGEDVLLLNSQGNGALFVQAPARTFTETAATAAAGLNVALVSDLHAAIDLNGDGRDDVVVENNYAVQCSAPAALGTFFPNTNGPGLTTPGGALAAPLPGQELLVDLDANGKPDYLTFDSDSGTSGASLLEVYLQ